MRFQTELVPATLIRRYKRFLADCTLEDGREVTAHCANPGAMMGLADPGVRIWLEPNDDPKKKLKFGWRLVEHPSGDFTGVDTAVPNRAVRSALAARAIGPLAAYTQVHPEQKYDANSRIDFLLRGDGLPDCYLEVKSVTLSRTPGLAEFPDSVTARGARHLDALTRVVQNGGRAVMLYLVQRTDCSRFALAADIDPAYGAAHARAARAGVETLCFGTHITLLGIDVGDPIALDI
jgi:sugar fermentation stimulation protein A